MFVFFIQKKKPTHKNKVKADIFSIANMFIIGWFSWIKNKNEWSFILIIELIKVAFIIKSNCRKKF